jgi:hypothetical protein
MTLSIKALNTVLLSVTNKPIMLSVILPSVIMLIVVASFLMEQFCWCRNIKNYGTKNNDSHKYFFCLILQ